MNIPVFHVDAFTSELFGGNPAAVCLLNDWPAKSVLQKIAAEINLVTTAFLLPMKEGYEIRWFTPIEEISLCGHATLAAGHVLYHHLGRKQPEVVLYSASGELKINRRGERIALEFPILELAPAQPLTEPDFHRAESYRSSHKWMVVLPEEEAVRDYQPDLQRIARMDARGLILTAPGNEVDFVSRYFAPQAGIPEDFVTGSNHCLLAPFWSRRLGKKRLVAAQLSGRQGLLHCEVKEQSVEISGEAITFKEGELLF